MPESLLMISTHAKSYVKLSVVPELAILLDLSRTRVPNKTKLLLAGPVDERLTEGGYKLLV